MLVAMKRTDPKTSKQVKVRKSMPLVVSSDSRVALGSSRRLTARRKKATTPESWKKGRRESGTVRLNRTALCQPGFMRLAPQLLCVVGSAGLLGGTPVFPILVSLIALLSALYVILSREYPPKVEQWGYATVGMILGFWLRQS